MVIFLSLQKKVFQNLLSPTCVHHLFQFFSNLKERELLGRDLHDLPGLWVPAFVAAVISHHKASKSSDLDSVPLLQTFFHPVEKSVNNDLCNFLCHIRLL